MDLPPPYTPLPGSSDSPYPYPYPPPPPPPSQQQQPPPPTKSPYLALASPDAPDARSSSQVSLVPAPVAEEAGDRRTLLVVYIHGFMGNETSFQSFPAHLHNLLCVTLDPLGYVVHTKVYPKFKTRHNILVATENFSQWLSQFERPATDVVLLGHSMGGLLSADVALLRDNTGFRRRHRLLGTISFDTPFLGMHPGVISAGLGSLFRPVPKSPPPPPQSEDPSASTAPLHAVSSAGSGSQIDPFFSQKPQRNFTVAVPKKEGTWDSTFRFINKYHTHLTQATGQYLMSHLEFGGCLADPIGLRDRYLAVRGLEDADPDRVRFVNYYTSSTGRAKDATPAPEHTAELSPYRERPASAHTRSLSASSHTASVGSADMQHLPPDPEDYYDGPVAVHILPPEDEVSDGDGDDDDDDDEKAEVVDIPPREGSAEVDEKSALGLEGPLLDTGDAPPPLPPLPVPPVPFDYEAIPDPGVRKAAMKQAGRVLRRYEKAVRDYEKAIRDRAKALEKMARKREKGKEKEERGKEKERGEYEGKGKSRRKERRRGKEREGLEGCQNSREKEVQAQTEEVHQELGETQWPSSEQEKQELERLRREQERMDAEHRRLTGTSSPPAPSPPPPPVSSPPPPPPARPQSQPRPQSPLPRQQPAKKKRDRRFCILPSDKLDKCWVKVEMTGVDEVGAHCGLFFMGEVYERLVGDVAGRIEEWVGEEVTQRVVQEGEGRGGGGWGGGGWGEKTNPFR